MKRFSFQDARMLEAVIRARRDVRGNLFTSEAVSREEIDTILEAAMHAPSVGYSQPWKFVVIRDSKIRDAVYENFKRTYKKSKKKFKHRPLYKKLKLEALKETSVHIAVFYHHQGGSILGQTSQPDTGRYSVAAAIQNMWLMARAMNIGIGWVSILSPGKVRRLLGLGEAYELVGYLCVGKVRKFLNEPELKTKKWQEAKKKRQTVLHIESSKQRGSHSAIEVITGDKSSLQPLIDKKATFMLALSNTATAKIKGISQAGLPGLMHLTPTLDAEFLSRGKLKSLKKLPKTQKGIPTPALISRAVHLLHPFGRIEALDLGLKTPPRFKGRLHRFGIAPSKSIAKGAGIDAKAVFEKGYAFAESYRLRDDYLILGESVPSGTTTAATAALALGYDAKALFSSSFKDVPDTIREKTITKALANAKGSTDLFEILGSVSDNMLLFNAGFILGVNGRFPVVLAGGTQMAAVLLVANSVIKALRSNRYRHSAPHMQHASFGHIMLCTTKWVAKDRNSDIKALLEMLEFPVNAYYADFDFSLSHHPALKLYDKGEAKEGVGAGGALMYGFLNGLTHEEITRQTEGFLV